jgi:hypothetical protein
MCLRMQASIAPELCLVTLPKCTLRDLVSADLYAPRQAGMIGFITLQQSAPSQMTWQDSNPVFLHSFDYHTGIPTIIDPSATINYPSTTGSIIVGISVAMCWALGMHTRPASAPVKSCLILTHISLISAEIGLILIRSSKHHYINTY